jgi:serine/threonine-protein kinase
VSTLIGSSVGEYRLDALLGEGSAGCVYRATHAFLGYVVAVKVLYDAVRGPGFKSRFFEHAQGVTTLTHPNIAKVYHYGEDQDKFYIVTELVSGGSLESTFSDQPSGNWNASYWSAVDSVLQGADGLSAVHLKGLVHGDIKPSNLLLAHAEDGTFVTKLTDIGIAQLLLESGSTKDQRASNLAYLSPEQQQGLPPDQRSDIYCLGAILYELTTRNAVVRAKAAPGGGIQIAITPPRQLIPDFPQELETVILRCLSTDPKGRFATARELSGALRVLLDKSGYYAPKPKSETSSTKPASHTGGRDSFPKPPDLPPEARQANIPCVQAIDSTGAVIETKMLSGAGVTFGTAPTNDIIVRSDRISERHMRLDWDGQQQVTVTDLGSSAGTFLDRHLLLPQIAHLWIKDKWVQAGPYFLWLHPPQGRDPQRDEKIDVVMDQPSRSLTLIPGRQMVCRVTLVNKKSIADAGYITIEGMPEEWIVGENRDIYLNPFEKSEVELTINVPKAPSSRAKDYAVRIRANSRAHPDTQQGFTDASWAVAEFDDMSLEVTPQKAGGRKQARFSVTIQNQSNHPVEHCGLNAAAEERQLDLRLSKHGHKEHSKLEFTLPWDPSGTKTHVKLHVGAPRRWVGTPNSHPITVHALPGPGKPALTDEAEFIHKPYFPTWLLALAPVLLIGLIFLAMFTFKPVMPDLSVTPMRPDAGKPVTISWNARHASRVQILIDDLAVPGLNPTANGTYTFLDGFQRDFKIKVNAENIFGDAPPKEVDVHVILPTAVPPVVDFSVSSQRIFAGESVTIRWKVTGATDINLSLKGSVESEGAVTDTPAAPAVTYTITAKNGDKETTKSLKVDVNPPTLNVGPLRLAASRLKLNVGETLVFTWAAPNAQTVRIDAPVTPAQLTGDQGQKAVVFTGKGLYQFKLIATDANNREYTSSPPIQITVDCSLKQKILQQCHSELGLKWAN